MGASGPADPPALRLRGLRRWFGEIDVLQGLDLELGSGRTLAVLGPNGAGKSTLLRVLASLLRPSEGEVEVLGCRLPRESWRVRGRIGLLGHRNLLYEELSGIENLRFHARLHGIATGAAEPRIAALLEQVGMAGHADRRVAELSAGMARRLGVARCLLHEPELLLLDEPFAHLDPEATRELAGLLGSRAGRARVVVSHDPAAALADADDALLLDRDGAVLATGPASGIVPSRLDSAYTHPSSAAESGR